MSNSKLNFNILYGKIGIYKPLKVLIPLAYKSHTLIALAQAASQKLIEPHILGDEKIVLANIKANNLNLSLFNIITPKNSTNIMQEATQLIIEQNFNALMKGDHSTAELMSAVLKSKNNLKLHNIVSHISMVEIPTYHKSLFISDCGININPDLTTKIGIINNCVGLINKLGIKKPNVVALSAIEKTNPKIPSTIDAQMLANNVNLQAICNIEGPLGFDNAISKEAAKIKNLKSNIAGNVDILIVPNIETGNILFKALNYLAKAKTAGIVVGAKVPIILTSRSDSINSRLNSIMLALAYYYGY